ncbi:hypothetical protein F5888DRAFT_1114705 [Russula emetica]|nr:hypothetical protein F5888DRAFT_1114705 [Russula emetica]
MYPLLTINSGSGRETGSSTGGQPEGRIGARRRLRSVPRDGIISVVIGWYYSGNALEWKKWGPINTEHDSLTWGSLVGERRATVGQVLPTRITMRDYDPFRVRRALEMLASGRAGPGKEVKLECGNVVKVVKETSSYRGGEWFCDDIETSLAYVETIMLYLGCEGIFMDEDNLLAEVHTEAGKETICILCDTIPIPIFVSHLENTDLDICVKVTM